MSGMVVSNTSSILLLTFKLISDIVFFIVCWLFD